MPAHPKVVIADCSFPNNDPERRVLAEIGVEPILGQADTEEKAIALCAGADAIVVQYAPMTRRVIERLDRARAIVRYGIGLDNVDIAAASDHGIWVVNAPGFCKEEVAAHTMAMLLAFARKLFVLDRTVREGQWETIGVMRPTPRLSRQTLGLVGFGSIAREVSKAAKALGMRVVACAPRTTAETMAEYGVEKAPFPDLLHQADYLSLHCPLTPETRHLINAETLAQMKPSAVLLNTSRGGLVDEPSLIEALRSGRLGGAGLDVVATEPLPMDSPLRSLPNVILTPHASYYSDGAQEELQTRVAQEVVRVLRGEEPQNAVNREAGPRRF